MKQTRVRQPTKRDTIYNSTYIESPVNLLKGRKNCPNLNKKSQNTQELIVNQSQSLNNLTTAIIITATTTTT